MTRNKQTISTNNNGSLYCTPPDDEVQVPKIHLVSHFQKYRDAIKANPSIQDIIGIISLWLPIFTSDFKGLLNIQAGTLKGIYIGIALIFSFFMIKPSFIWIGKFFSKDLQIKYETDPEKRVENILR